jgi:hypothetical protein
MVHQSSVNHVDLMISANDDSVLVLKLETGKTLP